MIRENCPFQNTNVKNRKTNNGHLASKAMQSSAEMDSPGFLSSCAEVCRHQRQPNDSRIVSPNALAINRLA